MNKTLLLKQIIEALEALYQSASRAAMQAYDTATHDENVAENKYDTLGLEASYLAQGQAQRVAECEADLVTFKNLAVIEFAQDAAIEIGALVSLIDDRGEERMLFLGPVAGGLKVNCCDREITTITPSSPLGQALIGQFVDDEIALNVGGERVRYGITGIY